MILLIFLAPMQYFTLLLRASGRNPMICPVTQQKTLLSRMCCFNLAANISMFGMVVGITDLYGWSGDVP